MEILNREAVGMDERIEEMKSEGFPAYTTATGWLGYTDEEVVRKVALAKAEGFTAFKMKCGVSIEDDVRRAKFMREAIGPDMCVRACGYCLFVARPVDVSVGGFDNLATI